MSLPSLKIQVDSKYEHKCHTTLGDCINSKAYIETIFQVIRYRKEIVGFYHEKPMENFNYNSASYRAEKCGRLMIRKLYRQGDGSAVCINPNYPKRQNADEKERKTNRNPSKVNTTNNLIAFDNKFLCLFDHPRRSDCQFPVHWFSYYKSTALQH